MGLIGQVQTGVGIGGTEVGRSETDATGVYLRAEVGGADRTAFRLGYVRVGGTDEGGRGTDATALSQKSHSLLPQFHPLLN